MLLFVQLFVSRAYTRCKLDTGALSLLNAEALERAPTPLFGWPVRHLTHGVFFHKIMDNHNAKVTWLTEISVIVTCSEILMLSISRSATTSFSNPTNELLGLAKKDIFDVNNVRRASLVFIVFQYFNQWPLHCLLLNIHLKTACVSVEQKNTK